MALAHHPEVSRSLTGHVGGIFKSKRGRWILATVWGLAGLAVAGAFPLALLVLCAGAAAAALPVGPAGAATQAGASGAVLVASGIGTSQALGVAVAIQAVGVLCGGGIVLFSGVARGVRRRGART